MKGNIAGKATLQLFCLKDKGRAQVAETRKRKTFAEETSKAMERFVESEGCKEAAQDSREIQRWQHSHQLRAWEENLGLGSSCVRGEMQ